ncbi:DUF4234 domain-containing protein [Anaeromicropila populeti]|uniref:DUF4234 domain-containing protein n=1 Tax=Anaeromicropila populeti TaxID=37658 RepID=A0A1I6HXK7_9FIRM|nr:DUF4234 domain-containing protein [Anaeromicropila populeti]SFR59148.1 protein of unknown function [Anaeromicropila populeti]
MITQRNIALCIILTLITCGIYGLYWMICLNSDSQIVSKDTGVSGGLLILLSIVTCGIYTIYWMYKLGDRIDMAKASRGVTSANTGVLYLVLTIFGLSIISYCLAQNELNKLA